MRRSVRAATVGFVYKGPDVKPDHHVNRLAGDFAFYFGSSTICP